MWLTTEFVDVADLEKQKQLLVLLRISTAPHCTPFLEAQVPPAAGSAFPHLGRPGRWPPASQVLAESMQPSLSLYTALPLGLTPYTIGAAGAATV